VQADSGDASSTIAEKSLTTLLDSKVDVIIGPASSALASRLIPKTIADHVAMISPAATLPQLSGSQDDGFFFRTVPAYPLQALALAKAMAAAGSPRIALVYSDDAPGQSLAAALPPAVKDQSGAVIASLGVAPDAKKFDTVLAALADAKPDAVVLATQGGATTLSKALITALTAAHLGGPKLWLTTQNLADYSRALPGGRLKGAHGVLDGRTPSATFIAELAKQNPRLTRYDYAAEAYDATVIAALAAALAKSDSGDAIKAELPTVTTQGILCTGFSECVDVLKTDSDIHYDGVSGPLNFDANGDIKSAYYGGYIYDARNRSSRVSTVLVP
jgi:branched-chain amino acid transport system substrate-binding protein